MDFGIAPIMKCDHENSEFQVCKNETIRFQSTTLHVTKMTDKNIKDTHQQIQQERQNIS